MEKGLFKEEEEREGKNYRFRWTVLIINMMNKIVKKTFKKGRFIDDKLFKVFIDQGNEVKGEFAIIVGKKFGKAFERNKIKRI